MNIYTILLQKDKFDTFFPKLKPSHDTTASKSTAKRASVPKPTTGSMKIQQQLFGITCHDVLHAPEAKNKKQGKNITKKWEMPSAMRETFVRKQPEVPTKYNNYEMVREVGKGGFAEVYQVREKTTLVTYAMKQYNLANALQCYKNQCMIGEHFFKDGKLRQQFATRDEGVPLIGFVDKFKSGKKGYIIQEMAGASLSKAISEIRGVFYKGQRVYEIQFTQFHHSLKNKSKLAKLVLDIAKGVKLLNSQGFLHCDLKPQNILVSPHSQDLQCKLIDFGSCFSYKEGLPRITITPQYMPPQLLDALQSDNQNADLSGVDLWSIGCLIYEIVTGVPLWFRYKCKLEIYGKQSLCLSPFALTNREYKKIIKKQREMCQGVRNVSFVCGQFQWVRKLLARILVVEQADRITLDELIGVLEGQVRTGK